MELNINCINKELKRIILNKNKYSTEVILYALGAIELIFQIKKINIIPIKFIKYLKKIKDNMNCYIDFQYLNYISKNKKKIFIKDNSIQLSNSSSSSSSSSSNLNNKIQKMLKEDSILLKKIIKKEKKSLKMDDYGRIDNYIIKLIKMLFDLLDFNRDGYISALDAIQILKINKKNPFILQNNFDKIIVDLLVFEMNNKIDFYDFYKYII